MGQKAASRLLARNRKGREILSRGRNLCLQKKGSSANKNIQKNLRSDSNPKPPIPNTLNIQTIYQKDKLKLLIAETRPTENRMGM